MDYLLPSERGKEKGVSSEVGADAMTEYGLYTVKSWKLQQRSSGHK